MRRGRRSGRDGSSAGQIVTAPFAFVRARAPAIDTLAPSTGLPRRVTQILTRGRGVPRRVALALNTQARPGRGSEVQQRHGRRERRLLRQRGDQEVQLAAEQIRHVKALRLALHVLQLHLQAAGAAGQIHGPDLVGRALGAGQEQSSPAERGTRHAAGRHRAREASHGVDRWRGR